MAFEYYDLLWVGKDASADEIKRAFRKKAMECHPDRHKWDKTKEEEFKKINEAYSVLSDAQKKAHYDRFGTADANNGFSGWGFSGWFDMDLGDIFESFFGGGMGGGRSQKSRQDIGEDIEILLRVSLEEAIRGTAKTVNFKRKSVCKTCKGTGAKDGKYHDCNTCHGSWYVRHRRETIFGVMEQTAPCHICNGTGKQVAEKCDDCNGKKYEEVSIKKDIEVPAGIESRMSIKIRSEGNEGRDGTGDLYVTFEVPDREAWLERNGSELHYSIKIPPHEAVLWIEKNIEIPVLGKKKIQLDPGTQHGHTIRFKWEGMEVVWRGTKGDLFIHVEIDIPTKISKEQRELYEKLMEFSGGKKSDKGFFSHLFD